MEPPISNKTSKGKAKVNDSTSNNTTTTTRNQQEIEFSYYANKFVLPQPNKNSKHQFADFFYENNIPSRVAESRSLSDLLNVDGNGVIQQSIPSAHELNNGPIMRSKFQKIHLYVQEIKRSWPSTGCSVILDGWVDQSGKTLVSVLVHSPRGTVYLRSLDTSNVNSEEMIDGIFNEVGSDNIVQIISYGESALLDAVAMRVRSRHSSVFWTTSATYCLALIVERVVDSLGWVQKTIDQAKKITRLFHSNNSLLNNIRKGSDDHGLVVPSKIKAAIPFITLENMLLKEEDLKLILRSPEWTESQHYGLSPNAKEVVLLIEDESFWKNVALLVKATIPIINVINVLNNALDDEHRPQMGIVYETMDQLKETICVEIGKRKAREFWVIIDDVWNRILHSPLHAAGYYLNPKLSYTDDFVIDSEVMTGLLSTISKIGGDAKTQSLITQQLHLFEDCLGDFKHGTKELKFLSPVEWWRKFGNQCPELQKFAIKILGLSCNGATFYELNREIAEKMLSFRETHPMHKKLKDQVFVSYNSYMKHFKQLGQKFSIEALDIDPFDDWIVGEI